MDDNTKLQIPIISQNGLVIYTISDDNYNLSINSDTKNIVAYSDDLFATMAEYATKTRALKALLLVESHIEKCIKVAAERGFCSSNPFQFPQDSEELDET